jgi:hypothetical protein
MPCWQPPAWYGKLENGQPWLPVFLWQPEIMITIRPLFSIRFQRSIMITRHAQMRMLEREVDAGLLKKNGVRHDIDTILK